jgi:hypothetical protein
MQKQLSDVEDGGTFCLVGAGSYSDSVPRKCGSDAHSAWYWPVINELMAFYGGILVPAAIRIKTRIIKVFWDIILKWCILNAVYIDIVGEVIYRTN